jgi:hypothetical protein
MRKSFYQELRMGIFLLLVLMKVSVQAQTYLTDVYKPVESYKDTCQQFLIHGVNLIQLLQQRYELYLILTSEVKKFMRKISQ